jgi:ferredoxin
MGLFETSKPRYETRLPWGELVKLRIDASRCEGTGMCVKLAPHLFRLDRLEGPAKVLIEDVHGELAQQAQEAETLCPTSAISVLPD